jgi:hypothetical protein
MTLPSPFKTLFIILLVATSCGKKLPEIQGADFKVWKDDAKGCNSLRMTISDTIMAQKSLLFGLNEMEIVDILGRPDQRELSGRNQKFYHYLLEPGEACHTDLASPKKLVVRFNAVGLTKEITIE